MAEKKPAKGPSSPMGWRKLGPHPECSDTPVTYVSLRRPAALALRPALPARINIMQSTSTLRCHGCGADYHVGPHLAMLYRPDLCPTCHAPHIDKRRKGAPRHPPPETTQAAQIAREVASVVKRQVKQRRQQVARVLGVGAATLREPHLAHSMQAAALRELADKHGIEVPATESVVAPPPMSVEDAVQAELASRELARRKFIHFVQRHRPKYHAGWFHIDLAARLEKFARDIMDGKSPRLLIEAPPRSGKSTLASEDFTPWFYGHYPEAEVIASAYSSSLANEFSRKVQDTMRSADYQLLFNGLGVREGNESIESWRNSAGGSYLAAGVGGPITGRGAHALMIEDPFKNREDADSPVVRKKVWDWYTSTAYTRLAPGGGVCVIHTRWHMDDLIGRLRTQMVEAAKIEAETGEWPEDVDRWEVVSYPAIAVEDEPFRLRGEALHPERYPISALLRIRRTVGPRDWSALYQQNPVPEEGAYFSKDMIRYFTAAPDGRDFVTVDLAISTAQYADYTVFLICRVDIAGDMYVLDAVRARADAGRIVTTFEDTFVRYKPFVFGVERGAIYEAIMPLLEKHIREKGLYALRVEPISVGNKDKLTRARSIQGRMGQGKVFLKEGAPYLDWLLPEILSFPHAKNDDGVDCLGIAGRMLNDVVYVAPPPPMQSKSWRDKLSRYVSSSGGNTRHPAMGA